MTKISQEDLEALLELFDRSSWREIRVQGEGFDLFASKDPEARISDPVVTLRQDPPSKPKRALDPAEACNRTDAGSELPMDSDTLHVTATAQSNWTPVRAPCLGTFYSSPKPGSPPFVTVGQKVTADTEVCIVEVMKLFTTVRAGVTGTVREILVKDSELVEFDQPLLLIEPDA